MALSCHVELSEMDVCKTDKSYNEYEDKPYGFATVLTLGDVSNLVQKSLSNYCKRPSAEMKYNISCCKCHIRRPVSLYYPSSLWLFAKVLHVSTSNNFKTATGRGLLVYRAKTESS